jgi:hypothetical protein
MLEIITFKEKRFILAYSFGGFSPWSVDPIVFGHLAGVEIQ